MTRYSKHFSTKKTPQSQAIPGREADMTKNNAGGVTFKASEITQLERFLILGSEGGSYYVSQHKLTVDNAQNVVACIRKYGKVVVDKAVEVSVEGRAPRNDAAIFVLALCTHFGDAETKKAAYENITKVCRIGTHLYSFMEAAKELRGSSRGFRRGVAKFYEDRNADQLAMQIIKYRQRNGWTHKDVISLAHPQVDDEARNHILRYAVGNEKRPADKEKVGALILAFEELQKTDSVREACKLIAKYNLPREAVPTAMLNEVKIWEALLPSMPITATIRNLGKMSQVGLLKSNLDASTKMVVERLTDVDVLRKGRVHPIQVLFALKTYTSGQGFRGKLSWNPVGRIKDALDDAFYKAFKAVKPTGKNFLLGVDVSGSMSWAHLDGNITCCEAAAAMAMVTARTEENYEIRGFCHDFVDLGITAKDTLPAAIRKAQKNNFGGTDCSLPMTYALKEKLDVDCFIVYTDSETWAGPIQPVQALNKYRQFIGKPSKLIVMGMQANEFTIADPNDKGMLDVVGFDASVPNLVRNFVIEQ